MSHMHDTDELLAELLEQLVSQSKQGRSPDLEAVIREHPALEGELRELWATAMMAEDFAAMTGELSSLTGDGTRPQLDHAPTPVIAEMPSQVGEYRPIKEIGRGGMGVVYQARQSSLGRTVALKMLLRGQLASAADVARFCAEAESAARLNHPNIVPVYEVGQHAGQPYFSMKLIEGTTVAQRLVEGPLPAREAARLLLPVCRAIADAHRNGVLHRDLKPSNVLIDVEGRPYVTDFGLAKRVPTDQTTEGEFVSGGLTLSGAILGTPGYMSPEQAAGQRGEIGPATDVYGLGAILYAMLTGRPPFQSASPLDTILMVLDQDLIPPRVINPKADADLSMIALKCLQKPADLRYDTADALADDLQAFLANEPVSARTSHFSQVISRAFRETHHAVVLENWGLLWMWHALVLLVLCAVTNALLLLGWESRWPYLLLWGAGLGIWAAIFWNLRQRSGPITFVERQVAHVWAGSMCATTLLYGVEWLLGLNVLQLSPVLGLVSGTVFLVKAGILSGAFYVQAGVLFLTALAMASLQQSSLPDVSVLLFGIVSAACFFFPGLKYYRQRLEQTGRASS